MRAVAIGDFICDLCITLYSKYPERSDLNSQLTIIPKACWYLIRSSEGLRASKRLARDLIHISLVSAAPTTVLMLVTLVMRVRKSFEGSMYEQAAQALLVRSFPHIHYKAEADRVLPC